MQHEPPPEEPPVPVLAVWNGATRRVTITFDKNLQNVSLDLANWILTYTSGTLNPISATILDEKVTLQFTTAPGASHIAFDPPPFDLIGVNGLAVQGFGLNV